MPDIAANTTLTGTLTEAYTITAAGVTVNGDAVIDGENTRRPMNINGQDDITIRGITLANGSTWSLYSDGSDGVTLDGIVAHTPGQFSCCELDDTDNVLVKDSQFYGSANQHGMLCVASTADITGIRYTNSSSYDNGDKGLFVVGIGSLRASDVVVDGCLAERNGDGLYCIKVNGPIVKNTLSRNNTDVTDVGEGYGLAFQECPNVSVQDCKMFANRTDGVEIWGSADQNANGGVIERCLIKDHTNTNIQGIDLRTNFTSNCRVVGNVLINNDRGMNLDGANENNTCAQNTIYGGRSSIRMERTATPVTAGWTYVNCIFDSFTANWGGIDGASANATIVSADHNLYRGAFASGGTSLARLGGTNYTTSTITDLDANALTADPRFIDPSSDDLRLNGDSPCVRAGTKWWSGPHPVGQDGEPFPAYGISIGGIQSQDVPGHPKQL